MVADEVISSVWIYRQINKILTARNRKPIWRSLLVITINTNAVIAVNVNAFSGVDLSRKSEDNGGGVGNVNRLKIFYIECMNSLSGAYISCNNRIIINVRNR